MYSSPEDVCSVKVFEGSPQVKTHYQKVNGQWIEPGTGSITSGDVQTMIENKQNLYTGTSLSDITSPKEGDVAFITVTASSTTWVAHDTSDVEAWCNWENPSWPQGTFKVSADTSVTKTATEYVDIVFADMSGEEPVAYYLGWGYIQNRGWVYKNGFYDWADWDGGEFTFDTPAYDDISITLSPEDFDATVYELQTGVTTSQTQYSYVNGQWVETGVGSGGEQFVELTMDEYTGLTSYTENTTYIITDAPSIDLNTLATTGELATKADKVTVTGNSSDLKFPKWNSQGIITGYTKQYYDRTLTLNNVGIAWAAGGNISFFAPTSGGTAGQVLQSNGSGAPVWSTFKMWFGTQTQYDAITTKDSSTIYFVKED
jgi:hypothetical protein